MKLPERCRESAAEAKLQPKCMDEQTNADILRDVANYYSEKLAQHGQTPRGVDWNGEEGQNLRFHQLSKLIGTGSPFSVSDLGCGYGAFYDFLEKSHQKFDYLGVDVAESMIETARARLKVRPNARFIRASVPDCVSEYGIASGLFNVRLGRTDSEWQSYVDATLDELDRTSSRGFAFNCLTAYSDADRMRSDLYYADPCRLFDFCKRRYSRNVALLHDYGLYEFTMLVRKV